MAEEVFVQMKCEQKGYISKEEYVKVAAKMVGEESAVALFDAVDLNKNGKVYTQL